MSKPFRKLPMNAFEQGQMAKFDNVNRDYNPYSMYTNDREHQKWFNGYDEGGWEELCNSYCDEDQVINVALLALKAYHASPIPSVYAFADVLRDHMDMK